ncbi:hypothetical protein B5M47_01950 [candidate division CPR3 bacterium 4484_211]|uniref:Uncharacterized protein n=1 Tax=candidate division CPR3 bacterium 4484_211 TaxID=1968527 RepID=A0A1W9NZZ5_UNCC3|nr:MAG: hypothetical protein B5M47_01950 [candidate division CPR3 bacterium 4484_211]
MDNMSKQPLPTEIQLLPERELAQRKALTRRIHQISLTLIGLVLCLQAACIAALLARNSYEKTLFTAKTNLDQSLTKLERHQDSEDSFTRLAQNTSLLKTLNASTTRPTLILDLIEKAIPANVSLESILYSDFLTITGTTESYASIIYFINNLENNPLVQEASLSKVARSQPGVPIDFGINVKF